MTTPMIDYDHINLNEIDDSAKPLPQDFYTFEVNALTPKYVTISKPDSEFAGQSVLVMDGHFTIVDDEKYNGKRLKQGLFTPYRAAQIGLKRLQNATGVQQTSGQTLSEWGKGFETLTPPARFKALVELVPDRSDPSAPPSNRISFFTAKPV